MAKDIGTENVIQTNLEIERKIHTFDNIQGVLFEIGKLHNKLHEPNNT